ncbi:hypothetical protein [Adhaeribacter soli]|uniref:Uncharacterized protein n=1 Tax=Adhaeribacter soli TaxID=2607655 RepID=A0A5N1IMR4_9BACT|nr:hypothetical protein [Adhaeribacter soli]KAA9325207.1 hypothetical protein F0P94_18450 [Adhaeribacter soli]
MKLRLSTKYFRTRVAIWSSIFVIFVVYSIAIKLFIEDDIERALYFFLLGTISIIVPTAGILTYREKFSRLDKKRWQKPGIKPKLEVLSDWIIN